jgi:hypothetical protein
MFISMLCGYVDSVTDDFVVVSIISNLGAQPSSCYVFLIMIVQHQSLTLTAFCCQYPGAALLRLLFICLVYPCQYIVQSRLRLFIQRSKCWSILMLEALAMYIYMQGLIQSLCECGNDGINLASQSWWADMTHAKPRF